MINNIVKGLQTQADLIGIIEPEKRNKFMTVMVMYLADHDQELYKKAYIEGAIHATNEKAR